MLLRFLFLIIIIGLTGCGSFFASSSPRVWGDEAVADDTTKVDSSSKVKTKTQNTILRTTSLDKSINSYMGIRYKWGGETRKGLDCSGFIYRVFNDINSKEFKRISANEMYKTGTSVTFSNLKKGDLVFFGKNRSSKRATHVGIYIGNNTFAHAATTKGVSRSKLSNVYWKKKFIGFRRLSVR